MSLQRRKHCHHCAAAPAGRAATRVSCQARGGASPAEHQDEDAYEPAAKPEQPPLCPLRLQAAQPRAPNLCLREPADDVSRAPNNQVTCACMQHHWRSLAPAFTGSPLCTGCAGTGGCTRGVVKSHRCQHKRPIPVRTELPAPPAGRTQHRAHTWAARRRSPRRPRRPAAPGAGAPPRPCPAAQSARRSPRPPVPRLRPARLRS